MEDMGSGAELVLGVGGKADGQAVVKPVSDTNTVLEGLQMPAAQT